MSSLVITDAGISLKSFQELRNELKQAWISTFGSAIDLSPTSVDGHHIDLECKTIVSVSQLIQAVIDNFDPSKASGVWLDILGDYKSMERIKASYSVATVTFHGTAGTVVPSGTVVRYDGAPCDFTLQDDVAIDSEGNGEGKCKANSIGYVEIQIGEWKMVSSQPSGISCEVTQANAVGSGQNDETDAEYRARQKSYTGNGLATYDKMYAYMAAAIGIGRFSLRVNDEDTTVEGLPSHRFEFVVNGGVGTNDEIAQIIWNCKPAGIKGYGNTNGTAYDKLGLSHEVQFSRPIIQKLWIKIAITEYTEEALPSNFATLIKNEIAEWAESEYAPGKDVIPKRLYTPIYKVSGVLDATILVCVSDTEPQASAYVSEVIQVPASSRVVIAGISVE